MMLAIECISRLSDCDLILAFTSYVIRYISIFNLKQKVMFSHTHQYMTATDSIAFIFSPVIVPLSFYCQNIVLLRLLFSSILSGRGELWVWRTGRERRQTTSVAVQCLRTTRGRPLHLYLIQSQD